MIRDLRFSDLPRQLLPGGLGGEDWAYTRARLAAGPGQLSQMALLRWSVSSSRLQRAVASIERGKLTAVALLQARRGVRAWEVAHLYTSPDGLSGLSELLERCVASVAQRGGERLFLRVLFRCPAQDAARRAGFMPAYTEETFVLQRPMRPEPDAEVLPLRPALPVDAYGLFRLYNATVPANARTALGLTLDQWTDAFEDLGGSVREYVWEDNGRIQGWMRQAQRGKGVEVEALLHPDHGAQAPALTAAAASLAKAHDHVTWTVPSYQPALSLGLQRRGWQLGSTYAVLVRSATSRVREPSLMPVQA